LFCGPADYSQVASPLVVENNFLPPCDTLEFDKVTGITPFQNQSGWDTDVSRSGNLAYYKRGLELNLRFQLEKFMKIEQVKAYSGDKKTSYT
jgi:hypothetical protein